MIESVKISNFQSLHDVELDLGKFTVIVGASSSGKSALTRAIHAVASNALDSDNITRGNKLASVSLRTGDATVTIERNGNESSVYKIAKVGSKESRFTKLNRQVPAEVTEALGISPSTKEVASINFAGQFDTPYLLKEGSSSVARILGELTNVSTIFSAVREASRRAKAASSIVNIRKKDQEKLMSQLSDYVDISKQAKALSAAEKILDVSVSLETEIARLTRLLGQAQTASEALQGIKDIPELPELEPLLKAQTSLNRFKILISDLASNRKKIDEYQSQHAAANVEVLQAEEELHNTLVKAGKCPTCNQQVLDHA